uniref:Uncharacterized protein n=1 Tax=Salix viminalis TaxID=40686 RepID=A0A6N2KTG8_SALVM
MEEYMDYDIGSYRKDDWNLAQKLMINGISKVYQKPYPITESLWRLPDDRNCLSRRNPKRDDSKCTGCFEMNKEKLNYGNQGRKNTNRPGFQSRNRMREKNVAIVSNALNLGSSIQRAPLYVTLNQRLTFLDNTMCLIHATGFVDGWIDLIYFVLLHFKLGQQTNIIMLIMGKLLEFKHQFLP